VATKLRSQACIRCDYLRSTIQLDYYHITTSAAAADDGDATNGHDGNNHDRRKQAAAFDRRWGYILKVGTGPLMYTQSWYCIHCSFLFLFLLEARRTVGAKEPHYAYEALFKAARVIFRLPYDSARIYPAPGTCTLCVPELRSLQDEHVCQ
jgi:hypothetical protein